MSDQYCRILVAGGAGFIGSHIVEALLETGAEVTVLDNLSSGRMSNLENCRRSKNFHFVKGDICSTQQVRGAVKNVDAVFNDAAVVSVRLSVENPILVNKVNVDGALNLLKASVDSGVKRFVQASSASVYGDTEILPIVEDALVNPISPYAVSELAAESYARAFQKTYGLETVCLRYFNVYGPRQHYSPYTGAITIFMNQLLGNERITIFGDGEQTRDFVYVEDVAAANMLALARKEAVGEVFNIATGVATSVNVLVKTLMKIVGKARLDPLHASPKPGEIKCSCACIDKAKRILGYSPAFSIEKGLEQLVKWHTSKLSRSTGRKKQLSR